MARSPMSILLLAFLAACSSHPAGGSNTPGDTVADGSEFDLQPGETVKLADNSQLRYLRLVEDSRCPPDVRCVWAGDAILEFSWAPASGTPQQFQLHTGLEPRSHDAGKRRVALKAVARGAEPSATLHVEAQP